MRIFCLAYASNTKSSSDTEYAVSTDAAERKIYKSINKAYHLLMTYHTGFSHGLVKMARAKQWIDVEPYQAWKNICNQHATNKESSTA